MNKFIKNKFVLILSLVILFIVITSSIGNLNQSRNTDIKSSAFDISEILKDNRFRLKTKDEDRNSYAISQMSVCYQSGGKDGCYSDVAKLLFSQFNLRQILDIFAENETTPEVFSRCHEVTHFLSRLAYEKEKSVPKVFNQCAFTCHGGCYHGTLEAYLMEKKLANEQDYQTFMRKEIGSLCGKKENYTIPQVFNECVHGLGHGAMFVTDSEVPLALRLCDALSLQSDREGCYSGIFHENSSSSTNSDHPTRFIKADDPMYPCNILEEKYLSLCYRYQSSYFAILTNHDWQKTVDLCMQVPNQYQRECFQTIGTNQVGFTQDMLQMRDDCMLSPTKEYRDVCIAGVVVSLAGRYTNNPNRIISFCNLLYEENKKACFAQMGASVSSWSNNPQDRTRVCNLIPNSMYSSWCGGS